jgi:predicted RNase H-like HicB family nuclease
MATFSVLIEKDEDGRFVATCPALDGCVTEGETRQEAIENIKDVIRLCLEDMRQIGQPVPDVESVEIAV